MSFVNRELDKLGHALRNAPDGRYNEIYAAQQALKWATDPKAYRSPVAMLTDTQEGSIDCSVEIRHSPLPDISGPKLDAV